MTGTPAERCDVDWGSATRDQRCTRPTGHFGVHIDADGREWGYVPDEADPWGSGDEDQTEPGASSGPGVVPSLATPAERVAAGAAMLDQRIPGWHQEIELHAFRIESAYNCIIGQLGAGSYLAGTRRAYPGDEPMTTEEHGFIWSPPADDDTSDPEYDALEAAWRDEIARRRARLAQEWAGFRERSGK